MKKEQEQKLIEVLSLKLKRAEADFAKASRAVEKLNDEIHRVDVKRREVLSSSDLDTGKDAFCQWAERKMRTLSTQAAAAMAVKLEQQEILRRCFGQKDALLKALARMHADAARKARRQ